MLPMAVASWFICAWFQIFSRATIRSSSPPGDEGGGAKRIQEKKTVRNRMRDMEMASCLEKPRDGWRSRSLAGIAVTGILDARGLFSSVCLCICGPAVNGGLRARGSGERKGRKGGPLGGYGRKEQSGQIYTDRTQGGS